MAQLEFLDLDGCSSEERDFLARLLNPDRVRKAEVANGSGPARAEVGAAPQAAPAPGAPPSMALMPPFPGQVGARPPPAPPFPGQPHQQLAASAPPHPQQLMAAAMYPNNIYINQVHANVNLLPQVPHLHPPPQSMPPPHQIQSHHNQTVAAPLMNANGGGHRMLIPTSSAPPEMGGHAPSAPVHLPPQMLHGLPPGSQLSSATATPVHSSSGGATSSYIPPFPVQPGSQQPPPPLLPPTANMFQAAQNHFYQGPYQGIPATFPLPGMPGGQAVPPPHPIVSLAQNQQVLETQQMKQPLPQNQGQQFQNSSASFPQQQPPPDNMDSRQPSQVVPPQIVQPSHPDSVVQQEMVSPPDTASGSNVTHVPVHHEPVPEEPQAQDNDEGPDAEQERQSLQAELFIRPESNAESKPVSGEDLVQDQPQEMPAVSTKPKSWASLFKSNAPVTPSTETFDSNAGGSVAGGGKPTATVMPFSQAYDDPEAEGEPHLHALTADEVSLIEYLKNYSLNHKTPAFRPRGLKNRSNWCFVNAILQALTACPPFFHFLHSLPLFFLETGPALGASESAAVKGSDKRWPILRAVWLFLRDVEVQSHFPSRNRSKNKKAEDIPLGKTVEATSVLNSLLELSSDTFKVEEGRQEDAEEFLSFLLNGLNDEILGVIKLLDEGKEDGETEDGESGGQAGSASADGDGDDWKEVGPKRRSCITRRTATSQTPVAAIFQGQIRSCVNHSAGQPTATLQPFFTLQLDIQSESVRSVADALKVNFDTEALDGYICAKTKKEVDATRSLLLEELPPVLVLHLKRFVYAHGEEGSSSSPGGCQKLLKPIDFPVDLEIRKDILSPAAASKYRGNRERQYKLFSVVYHNGSEATKGHYVSDVYHASLSTWLHCDDGLVKPITEQNVLSHSPSGNSLPYILFYRRGDTMGQAERGSAMGAKPGAVANSSNPYRSSSSLSQS